MTDDLPTPPLPEATAYTRVSDPGFAKGISRSVWPPRSWMRSAVRCSSLITSRVTSTAVTPATSRRAAVDSLVSVSFIGQPDTVRKIDRATRPTSSTSTLLTIPSSVIGLRISGSLTRESALRSASWVGRTIVGMTPIVCRVGVPPVLGPIPAAGA